MEIFNHKNWALYILALPLLIAVDCDARAKAAKKTSSKNIVSVTKYLIINDSPSTFTITTDTDTYDIAPEEKKEIIHNDIHAPIEAISEEMDLTNSFTIDEPVSKIRITKKGYIALIPKQ